MRRVECAQEWWLLKSYQIHQIIIYLFCRRFHFGHSITKILHCLPWFECWAQYIVAIVYESLGRDSTLNKNRKLITWPFIADCFMSVSTKIRNEIIDDWHLMRTNGIRNKFWDFNAMCHSSGRERERDCSEVVDVATRDMTISQRKHIHSMSVRHCHGKYHSQRKTFIKSKIKMFEEWIVCETIALIRSHSARHSNWIKKKRASLKMYLAFRIFVLYYANRTPRKYNYKFRHCHRITWKQTFYCIVLFLCVHSCRPTSLAELFVVFFALFIDICYFQFFRISIFFFSFRSWLLLVFGWCEVVSRKVNQRQHPAPSTAERTIIANTN